MKQYLAWILCVLCMLLLAACTTEPSAPDATDTDGSTASVSDTVADFDPDNTLTGVVVQVHESSILVNGGFEAWENGGTDGLYVVSLRIEGGEAAPDVAIGDEVAVVCDGMIMESAPMQLGKIYSITVVKKTEVAYQPLDPSSLTAEKTYDNDHGAVLSAYPGRTVADYEGVCDYYTLYGWTLYCANELNGNRFSTYTNGDSLAHVYWIASDNELNIVRSDTEGASLPPRDLADGAGVASVTQLQQQTSETSGLCYVVTLSDGSHIIYDGGYTSTISQLLEELSAQNPDGEVHIRAWIMTHSHNDHYSGFQSLAHRKKSYLNRYDLTIKLDYFIMAPMSNQDALDIDADGQFFIDDIYECVKSFDGAKICYAHTGMTFDFPGMTLEVLYTAEDLFIDGSTGYFNDSSMITRLRPSREGSGETLSMLFLGDAGVDVANRLVAYYGDQLRSDMCQISHHGVENFPLSAYEVIAAPTLFYPCNNALYALTDRDADVRAALRASEVTKEILLRDNDKYTRYFDPAKNPEPIGKPDASGVLSTQE